MLDDFNINDLPFLLLVLIITCGFFQTLATAMSFSMNITTVIVVLVVYCIIFVPLLIAMKKYVF